MNFRRPKSIKLLPRTKAIFIVVVAVFKNLYFLFLKKDLKKGEQ